MSLIFNNTISIDCLSQPEPRDWLVIKIGTYMIAVPTRHDLNLPDAVLVAHDAKISGLLMDARTIIASNIISAERYDFAKLIVNKLESNIIPEIIFDSNVIKKFITHTLLIEVQNDLAVTLRSIDIIGHNLAQALHREMYDVPWVVESYPDNIRVSIKNSPDSSKIHIFL
jgi:hypothetical protein